MKSMIIQTRFRSISCSCSSSSINNIIGSGVTIVCILVVAMSLQQPYFGNAFVTILNQKYYEHRRIQKQNERVLPVPMVPLSLSIKSSSKTMTALFVFGSDPSSDSNSNSNSDSNSNNKRPKNIDNNYDDNKYDGINPNYKHLEFYIDQDDNSENTNNNIGNGLSLYDISRNEHFEKRRKRIEHERYIRNQFEQFGNKLWELRTEIDTLTNKLQSILLKNNGQLQSTALPSTTPTSTSTSISTNSKNNSNNNSNNNNNTSSSFVGLLEQPQEQQDQHEQQIRDQLRKAQSRDPELVYTIAVADMYRARAENNIKQYRMCSNQAQVARSCLPQFQLNGLWVGKYSTNSSGGGTSTYELINITYVGDTLIAEKITGDTNVPRGEITFQVDLSPLRRISLQSSSSSSSSSSATSTSFSSNNVDKDDDDNNNNNINNNNNNNELQQQHQQQQQPPTPPPSQPNTNTLYNHNHNILQPIQLTENAAKKWGIQKLPRYTGLGQVAEYGYKNHQWVPGQLILISDVYFSFVWLPIQEQIFFGRPSPELALKLIREQQEKEEKQQQKLNHHHRHHPQEKQDDYYQDHQQKQQKQLQKQSKQSKQPDTVPTPITANDDINIFKQYAMRCMDKTNEIYNYHPQENGTDDDDDDHDGTNNTDGPSTSGSGTFGCIWDSHDTDTCYFE